MPNDALQMSALADYVTDTAPVLALRLDTQRRVRTANAYARRLLGGNLAGRPFDELRVNFTAPPEWEAPETRAQRVSLNTAGGVPESFQFRFFALADGWLALGSLDVEEQQRLQSEVLNLNRELNDLTRQLHQANAELRELNALKNQFLGMAAHDLRKPVGVVMTYTEFVLDEAGDQLSEEHRQFLQTCLKAATGMKRLIDDFLDVAVIESGKLRLELASVPAAEILEGAMEVGRLIAARKKVELLAELVPEGSPVRVDASKLQQVLLNLIGNAVEHSQPGKRVWVSAQRAAEALRFAVRDEGPGLAPEDQARLFQPFSRAGTRKTAGERSIGLGLQIARKIVEAHQGRIWVESIPGCGATFHVALPLLSPEPSIPNPS